MMLNYIACDYWLVKSSGSHSPDLSTSHQPQWLALGFIGMEKLWVSPDSAHSNLVKTPEVLRLSKTKGTFTLQI